MKYLFSILLLSFVLSGMSQDVNPLTVHEWGTFTSKYTGYGKPYLDVHKTIDEKVPDFVHHVNFDTTFLTELDNKGYSYYAQRELLLLDVSIKMETPVLYFYSKTHVSNLTVKVKFPQGSISEFYPLPTIREDTNYIKSKLVFTYSNPTLSFKNYNGFATWNINILSPNDIPKPSEPDESVPNVWLAPRKTKANMIESNGEKEKYIFYRGLGSFTNPIIPTYTKSGNIVLTNQSGGIIPYVLLYERTHDGKRFIWKANSMTGNISGSYKRNGKEVSDETWDKVYRKGFIKALVGAGLYEDEAEAMLNTWDNSYFGKPGIKIFWIVPRSFTDEILPIFFSQKIESLERVMVGRTEIDPFYSWDIDKYIDDPIEVINKPDYTIFPNPSSSDLFIKSNNQETQTVELEIIDFTGRVVNTCKMELKPLEGSKIPFANLSKGIYYLRLLGQATKLVKIAIE